MNKLRAEILEYTPSQLMDSIEGRDDAADFRIDVITTGSQWQACATHVPTGIRAFGNPKSTPFFTKRDAWAQLMEKG
jgi:hypothetical protein